MSTLLSELYDRFFSKIDEDTTGKEELIYNLVKSAKSKSYKTTVHDLDYTLNNDATLEITSTSDILSGNITITLNSVNYTIMVTSSDSKLDIATNIQTVIDGLTSPTFTTNIDNTGSNPILIVLQNNTTDISISFTDTDSTGVDITISRTYEGDFTDTLDDDEIELLALWMVYEWNRREQQRLIKLKAYIGTKDFNRLPDKVAELKAVNLTMKDTLSDINDLKNEFNTYVYI